MKTNQRTLLFGIGNYGRQDDALGWLFLDKIATLLPDTFDVEYRYQLQVEDAELASHYDRIIFIDAHMNTQSKAFVWETCAAYASESYTSLELQPEAVVYLCNAIYKHFPDAFNLGIAGSSYRLSIGLSRLAENNLIKALDFFKNEVLQVKTEVLNPE